MLLLLKITPNLTLVGAYGVIYRGRHHAKDAKTPSTQRRKKGVLYVSIACSYQEGSLRSTGSVEVQDSYCNNDNFERL